MSTKATKVPRCPDRAPVTEDGEASVKPLHTLLLVRLVDSEEKTVGGIYLPETAIDRNMRTGVVLGIGPGVTTAAKRSESEISIGQAVLFRYTGEETIGMTDDRLLIPYSAVFAVLGETSESLDPVPTSDFFALPDWATFAGADYKDWEHFQNLTMFSVAVKFLEPFEDLAPLAQRMHEACVYNLRGLTELDLSSIHYSTREKLLITNVADDVWDGAFAINPEQSYLEFQKNATDLPNLHKTGPRLLTVIQETLASPEFKRIAGEHNSRVTCVVFRFHQRLKIEGRGSLRREANNSELMQQFLLLTKDANRGRNSTLDALDIRPADIGRIDIKISFEKRIAGHDYRVFMKIEAPANDEHTIIDIEWEIQDHAPGFVPLRTYAPVLTEFFKDQVLRKFYRRWFLENDDVKCSTTKR